ncbi:MAG: alginate export family protein [Planctomycetota bacterium]|nr:alginate export family protein [Planctomycetota bacterium]
MLLFRHAEGRARRSSGRLTPVALVALSALAADAAAQQSASGNAPPRFKLLRYEEDPRFYADPSRRLDLIDQLKYIPLSDDGGAFLSLAGDARLIYERFDSTLWGVGPQDNDGYLLQRYFLHADLRVGEHFRAYGTLKSSLENFREGGPRPTDENRADLHQAFVDFKLPLGGASSLTLRPGRQELNYGSARVVAVRNGPNDRQTFDAGRVILDLDMGSGRSVRTDVLYARAVETDRGEFDDNWFDEDRTLWGVYATAMLNSAHKLGFDAYYLGNDFEAKRYQRASGPDERHTIGTRWFANTGGFDADVEGAVQFGETGDEDAFGYLAAVNSGYTFASALLSPRLAVEAGVSSGDDGSGDVGTYNLLFARAGYYGELGILGNQNLVHLNPQLDLRLAEGLTFTAECYFFWRASEDDGIYTAGGGLLRAGTEAAGRFIGVQPTATLSYRPDRRWHLLAQYGYLSPGSFIDDTGPSEDIHFVRVEVTFSF